MALTETLLGISFVLVCFFPDLRSGRMRLPKTANCAWAPPIPRFEHWGHLPEEWRLERVMTHPQEMITYLPVQEHWPLLKPLIDLSIVSLPYSALELLGGQKKVTWQCLLQNHISRYHTVLQLLTNIIQSNLRVN